MIRTLKKETGSFYTCKSIADYIVEWAINKKEAIVLEPSFGDGSFLNAALKRFDELGEYSPIVYGVEIQEEPFFNFKNSNNNVHCYLQNFLDFQLDTFVDSVIGNPPYISLKNLTENDRKKALLLMKNYDINMPTSASLWMPFIIHSSEMINIGGRLGFVLPYEITYVRYAFPLWEYLQNNFGKINIYRIFNDFFPEVDVETIVFLAEDKGNKTNSINYKAYNTIEDLFLDNNIVNTKISISDIFKLNKPFECELLSSDTIKILSRLREDKQITLLIDECKFKIGYVCGNKTYFHPSQEIIEKYKIDSCNLIPCIINSKDINGQRNIGVNTENILPKNFLFYPQNIGKGEYEYISYGEDKKVNQGYKCKIRNPWYITPGLEIPDIILTVFGDTPRLIANTGKYIVTNSLLVGKIKRNVNISSKELVCRWYNSLTLLLIELYIHSLGGGTLVMIPGEMDKMEIISDFPIEKIDSVFNSINDCVLNKGIEAAYTLGDKIILKEIYHFTDKEIGEIKKSLKYLRSWRKPEMRRG